MLRMTLTAVALLALTADPVLAHHRPDHAGGPPQGVGQKPKQPGQPTLPGAPSGRFAIGTIAEGDDCSDLIAVPDEHELTLRGGPARVYTAPEHLVVEAFDGLAHVCLVDEEWIAEQDLRFIYHFTRIDEEEENGEGGEE